MKIRKILALAVALAAFLAPSTLLVAQTSGAREVTLLLRGEQITVTLSGEATIFVNEDDEIEVQTNPGETAVVNFGAFAVSLSGDSAATVDPVAATIFLDVGTIDVVPTPGVAPTDVTVTTDTAVVSLNGGAVNVTAETDGTGQVVETSVINRSAADVTVQNTTTQAVTILSQDLEVVADESTTVEPVVVPVVEPEPEPEPLPLIDELEELALEIIEEVEEIVIEVPDDLDDVVIIVDDEDEGPASPTS